MSRQVRVHAPGLLYHVLARGNNGQTVFVKDTDYQLFLESLEKTRQGYPFFLYAYVLMPNHFHFLLEVIEAPTGRLMQSLLARYVRRFNDAHERFGHLFQGRYKAILCDRESYLLELVRYIHLNPVRARLVDQPGKWLWSGHAEYLEAIGRGLIDPGPVMGELRSPAQYEAFVRDGIKGGYPPELHQGDGAPLPETNGVLRKAKKAEGLPAARRKLPLGRLWKQSASCAGLSPEVLRRGGRAGNLVRMRDSFVRRAVLEAGYKASDVAAFLGWHRSQVTRALQRSPD